MWKNIEKSKKTEMSSEIYAEFLKDSFESGNLPPWSYGLERLPKFILPLSSDFLDMKKRHAQETVRMVERELRLRYQEEGRKGRTEMHKIRMEYRKMRANPSEYHQKELDLEDALNENIEQTQNAVYAERQRYYNFPLTEEKLKRRLERFKRKERRNQNSREL